MYCQYCGRQLPDGSLFCDACGQAQDDQTMPIEYPTYAPADNGAINEIEKSDSDQRKGKSKGKRIAIVVAVVIVLIAAIVALCLVFDPLSLRDGGLFSADNASQGQESGNASDSEAEIQVPDITELLEEDAIDVLEGAGLVPQKATSEYSSLMAADHILSQYPSAGKMVSPGTTVEYTLSKGSKLESANGADSSESNKQYGFISGSYTWQQADEYCKKHGGQLAVIEDQDDWDQVQAALDQGGAAKAWLGASKDAYGMWKWVNGASMGAAAWADDEPQVAEDAEGYLVTNLVDNAWYWFAVSDSEALTSSEGAVGFVMETTE